MTPEVTERLEALHHQREAHIHAAAEPSVEARFDQAINRLSVLIGIGIVCVSGITGVFAYGRQAVTRDEVAREYVRQDVYARDHEHTTKQLDTIENKIDRALEALGRGGQ